MSTCKQNVHGNGEGEGAFRSNILQMAPVPDTLPSSILFTFCWIGMASIRGQMARTRVSNSRMQSRSTLRCSSWVIILICADDRDQELSIDAIPQKFGFDILEVQNGCVNLQKTVLDVLVSARVHPFPIHPKYTSLPSTVLRPRCKAQMALSPSLNSRTALAMCWMYGT